MVLCWRMYNVELPIAVDPGKDFCGVSPEVRHLWECLLFSCCCACSSILLGAMCACL